VRNHDTGDLTSISAEYLMAACGLLGKQYTPEERLMPSLAAYRGFCTLAGRADGRDSLVGSSDQRGKVRDSGCACWRCPTARGPGSCARAARRRSWWSAAARLHARPWKPQPRPALPRSRSCRAGERGGQPRSAAAGVARAVEAGGAAAQVDPALLAPVHHHVDDVHAARAVALEDGARAPLPAAVFLRPRRAHACRAHRRCISPGLHRHAGPSLHFAAPVLGVAFTPSRLRDTPGQCNDAIFQLSRAGVASILVDSVAAFARDGVFLRSGRFLLADTLVFAMGCTKLSPPPFLMELGAGAQEADVPAVAIRPANAAGPSVSLLSSAHARASGHVELHNYAFLGPSGRIGTASDVTYGYVPVGPKKQLDMFFHGMACRQRGQEAVRLAAMHTQCLSAALCLFHRPCRAGQ